MHEQLQIGKIVSSQGVRGEVRVIPLTDNPQRFEKLKGFYVENNGTKEKYRLESVKYLKNLVVLKLQGIDTPEQAEVLRGAFILIDRQDAVKLPEDTYFVCDLIGLKVRDENGAELGTLENILETGSNDVYVVKNESGKEILIPALKSVVRDISINAGVITVEVPKGLLDDEV